MFVWDSIAYYCAFGVFAYYNQRWNKQMSEGKEEGNSFVVMMSFLGMIAGLIYFIYYGLNISWVGAITAFFVGLAAMVFGVALEFLIGTSVVQRLSVFVWPVFAFLMFRSLVR